MIVQVTNDRLTRHEISWLLAQEAKGAAKALREGVTRLTNPPPAGNETTATAPSVHTTLDALDGAIGILSALQAQPGAQPVHRRGRIDLAALLYDVAPQARIKMAPGEGTEVFGDERELRRILHMLVNQTHANPSGAGLTASPEVDIRRDGEFVRISVDLGPDSSATTEIERRWLSRMAVQHGGRLEFKGGRQSVFLPADGATDQREVVELRKELEQAQQLGEAYARELAGFFASGLDSAESPAEQEAPGSSERFETILGIAAGLDGTLKDWLEQLREDASLAAREIGDRSELTQRLMRRQTFMQDHVRELSAIARCPADEPRAKLDAVAVTHEAIDGFEARCARGQIRVVLEAPESCMITTYPEAFKLLMRSLLNHAITATPQGKSVEIEILPHPDELWIHVTDAGPNVPQKARRDVLNHALAPARLGRPGGISLLVAHAAAGRLGGTLALSEAANARTQAQLRLGRSQS